MIGLIIGISSVIILVGIGNGSSKSITDQVSSLGTNLITVSVRNSATDYLKTEDMDEIEKVSGVKYVAPSISTSGTIKYKDTSQSISISGVTDTFLDVRAMTLARGRFVSLLDVENKNKVIVLGSTLATDLFGFLNPVDQYVTINGNNYKIIGVLESQGSSQGTNTDEIAMIPLSTAMTFAKTKNISTVYIEANSKDVVDSTLTSAETLLTELLNSTTTNKTFSISSQNQLLETMSSVTDSLTLLLAGIAGISLIVGGIGVMNVMLVSVSERTREIGVRKALGGKRKDIMVQFLIEALVLSIIGGVLGIGVGIAGGYIANGLGTTFVLSSDIVYISFLFSMAVGIIFGIFPAYKASKLKPIDALRYE